MMRPKDRCGLLMVLTGSLLVTGFTLSPILQAAPTPVNPNFRPGTRQSTDAVRSGQGNSAGMPAVRAPRQRSPDAALATHVAQSNAAKHGDEPPDDEPSDGQWHLGTPASATSVRQTG